MTSTALSIRDAVALCAAWADRFAKQHGCRALVIKGSILESQGLRGPHESIDVDLLVDPAQFTSFAEALADAGWHAPKDSTDAGIMEKHSATVSHTHWPITIDVHRYFPGFLAEPQTVFETFWERHTTTEIAGVHVNTPNPASHAALAALHYLRHPDSGLALINLPKLIELTPAALGETGLAELSEIAAATGSATILAEFLADVGAPPAADAPGLESALRQWELNTHAGSTTGWLVKVFREPIRRWPREIWYSLVLTDEQIAAHYTMPGESVRSARWRRIRKGLANSPRALAYLIRFRFTHRRKRGDA